MKQGEVFKAFFGIKPNQVRQTVIVSPIVYPKQFEKLTGQKGKHYKSILSYLVANFKNMTFVKTPMTQAAVADLVALLPQTKCKEVIFIGAMGGLADNLEIGDVFASSKASDFYSFKSIHAETDEQLRALKKKDVVGIDFEVKPFFKAAKKAKVKAYAYLVVTDLPIKKPFYKKKTIKEQLRIRGGMAFIVNLCKNH